jgi:hypothetical protein
MINPSPKGIVWLASYPKSGNTWLRVFLYHLTRLRHGFPREDDELNKLDRASTYEGRLFGLFEELAGKPMAEQSVRETMSVRPRAHAAIAERMPNICLVKTHNCLAELAGRPLVNPAASIGGIYIVRDPRDVALSLANHLGESVDHAISVMATPAFRTQNTAEGPFEVWGSWSENVLSWTGAGEESLLVLRYEDMLADPVAAFTAVATHLRQKPDAAMIAEAVEASTFASLADEEARRDFRERSERADRFFRSGRAGEWRERLSGEQAGRIVNAHRAAMAAVGYATD